MRSPSAFTRYGLGQKYDAHHDVGELDTLSGQQLASDGGYRVATALMYLTDTEEGGETAFPDSEWADPDLATGPWSECAQGCVAARARAGEALVFHSITPTNEIDPASMHTGCPVIKARLPPELYMVVWAAALTYATSLTPRGRSGL
jgi:prolyl 4-hydroxylase